MAKSNPRYECPTCKHRNTRNQLKQSNGICQYCKTAMPHTGWLGGQAASICQLISLSKGDAAELVTIADAAGVGINELIRAAVQVRLKDWESQPDKSTAARNDMILGKLYQR